MVGKRGISCAADMSCRLSAMTRRFRVQVVGLLDGDLRTILWVQQDQSAIRCGLALPGTDLHVTLREGEGTHDRGKGDADIAVAVMHSPRPATLEPKGAELIGSWVFSDLQADFQKLPTSKEGEPTSQVLLDLASLPQAFAVGVHIANLRHLFLWHVIASPSTQMIHVDTSAEPAVVVRVDTA